MHHFPYRENVRYNVPQTDEKRISEALYGVDDHVFDYDINTKPPVAISESEAVRVREAMEDAFDLMNDEQAAERWDEQLVFALSGEVMGLSIPHGRTVEVPLSDVRQVNVNFVKRVRELFLTVWPDWRILVVGNMREGEAPLLIYPTGVCIGDTAFDEPQEATAIQAWASSIEESREVTLLPRRKQMEAVRAVTASATTRIEDEQVILLRSFDNYDGDTSYVTHWFMFRISYALYRLSPSGIFAVEPVFDVSDSGEVLDETRLGTNGIAIVCVPTDYAASSGKYSITFTSTKSGDEISFSFEDGKLA